MPHTLYIDQNFVNMRAKPQPKGSIPIWIGGHADVALKRASKSGMDGMELFINRKDRRTNTKTI